MTEASGMRDAPSRITRASTAAITPGHSRSGLRATAAVCELTSTVFMDLTLVMAQRAERLRLRGPPGRNQGCDEYDGADDGEGAGERDQIGRADAEEHCAQQARRSQRRHEAHRRAGGAEPQPSRDELPDDGER